MLASTAAALCTTSTAFAELELNASLELDTDTRDTTQTECVYDQNGHVELGAVGTTYRGDYFAKAVGVVRLQTDGGEVDQTGFGINTGINVGEGFINLAASRLKDDDTDLDTTSFAANMTYGNFGLGYMHSNAEVAGSDDQKVNTLYAAYTMPILDLENASVTFAASMSKASNVADDKANALRVRFNYAF